MTCVGGATAPPTSELKKQAQEEHAIHPGFHGQWQSRDVHSDDSVPGGRLSTTRLHCPSISVYRKWVREVQLTQGGPSDTWAPGQRRNLSSVSTHRRRQSSEGGFSLLDSAMPEPGQVNAQVSQ